MKCLYWLYWLYWLCVGCLMFDVSLSLLQYKQWCSAMDQGKIPSEIKALLTGDEQKTPQGGGSTKTTKSGKTSVSSSSQG